MTITLLSGGGYLSLNYWQGRESERIAQEEAEQKRQTELRRAEAERKRRALVEAEPEAWATAKQTKSIAGYRRYLNDFPNGAHSVEAHRRIAELQEVARRKAEEAERKRQEEERRAEAERKRRALVEAERKAWATAKQTKSISGYRRYLREFPKGCTRQRRIGGLPNSRKQLGARLRKPNVSARRRNAGPRRNANGARWPQRNARRGRQRSRPNPYLGIVAISESSQRGCTRQRRIGGLPNSRKQLGAGQRKPNVSAWRRNAGPRRNAHGVRWPQRNARHGRKQSRPNQYLAIVAISKTFQRECIR